MFIYTYTIIYHETHVYSHTWLGDVALGCRSLVSISLDCLSLVSHSPVTAPLERALNLADPWYYYY